MKRTFVSDHITIDMDVPGNLSDEGTDMTKAIDSVCDLLVSLVKLANQQAKANDHD